MSVGLKGNEVVILGREELAELLRPEDVIGAMRRAAVALHCDPSVAPARTMLATDGGGLVLMPALVADSSMVGVKALTVIAANPARGLPYGQGVVLLFSSEDGRLLACVDGSYVTEVRTAATSAVATDMLSRPDSATLAIFGTGIQARAHARFICAVRPIRDIRIAGRSHEKALLAAHDIELLTGLPVSVRGYAEAAAGADILCGVTHSPEPVIPASVLEPGMHVNSVGLNRSGREVDAEALRRSKIVVESRQAAFSGVSAGSNDLMWAVAEGAISTDDVVAELGELVSGEKSVRSSAEDITLFKSVGSAIEDVSTAAAAFTRARETGAGTLVTM